MSKIKSLGDIESVMLHWAESKTINEEFGGDEFGDIDKEVDIGTLDRLMIAVSKKRSCGMDKISMTVTLKCGLEWADEQKFYIRENTIGLLAVLNN